MGSRKINFGKINLPSNDVKCNNDESAPSGFGTLEKTGNQDDNKNQSPSIDAPKKNIQKHAKSYDVDEMMAKFREKMENSKLDDLKTKTEANVDMSSIMGFSSFHTSSKAKPNPKAERIPPKQKLSTEILDKTSKKSVSNDENVAESDSDSDEEEGDEDNPLKSLPISHEITLQHSQKVVSALALDPAGARLVSGSHDYDVKFWDFNAMDSRFGSFRTIQPMECYPIRSIEYSTTGDCILVASGSAQAQVLNRDGSQTYECKKGDQYIVDMTKTKGHIASLYNAVWHKKDRNMFMTCAADCTVRLWDVNDIMTQKTVIKLKGRDGKKISPTHAIFNNDSSMIAVSTMDGALSLFPYKGPFIRPKLTHKTAHMPGTETSCLKFSCDGFRMLSRGGDDTMKLWDIRAFKEPVLVAENLENAYMGTDCWFSPDEKLVMTGTSIKQGSGELVFLDTVTFAEVYRYPVGESSVCRVLWHPKLNQIVVGCSNGRVKVYYSPELSFRGAKLCAAKPRRRQVKNNDLPVGLQEKVITPYSLPMYRENKHLFAKRRRERDRRDPIKSSAPDKPAYGLDAHKTKGCSMSAYVSKQLALDNHGPPAQEEDPREVLLRYADACEKDPYWVAPAYGPDSKNVYQKVTEDTPDEEPPSKKPMYFYQK